MSAPPLGRLPVLARPPEPSDMRVEDRRAIQGNHGVGDGPILPALDEDLLGSVRVEKHQIRAGIHQRGMRNLRPGRLGLVPEPRRAHVDDVVVVGDRGILRDRLGMDIEVIQKERLPGGGRSKAEPEGEENRKLGHAESVGERVGDWEGKWGAGEMAGVANESGNKKIVAALVDL